MVATILRQRLGAAVKKISLSRRAFVLSVALTLACSILLHLLNSLATFILRMNFLNWPNIDCNRKPPFLVILVSSELGQAKARMAIRETWGKERVIADKLIVTYFLLGTNLQAHDQIVVTTENLIYKDIIQKDFFDTYYNLTLKTLMGLEWIHKFCPQSTFVMKTDSDMFVNTYYLTELLLKRNSTKRLFTGLLKTNDVPIRDPYSKWFMSEEDYPRRKYPPFCSGTGYILSTDVASQVYIVSNKVPFLMLEDVFVGLCLAELKIKPEELHSKPIFFASQVPFSLCRYRKIITSHHHTPTQILVYWFGLESSMDEECPDDVGSSNTGLDGKQDW